MKITILIPHFKTGKMTAYTLAQLLKCKGKHEMEIIVVNNNPGDDTEQYLWKVTTEITVVHYPRGEYEQSHGIAFDHVLPFVKTEYFITLESDAYPVDENWLDYYENLVNADVDMAGSHLQLSGGIYIHPCGALYKRSLWQEAKDYCESIQYAYFPNMSVKEGFDCHTMIHRSVLGKVIENPEDYFDLSESYKPFTKEKALERLRFYSPVNGPFHNGMGMHDESVNTYGLRSIDSDASNILLNNKMKIIRRIGYEPGQWLSYYAIATGKKVVMIPTEIFWMYNQVGRQQDHTLTESGVYHIWGVSAFKDVDPSDTVAKYKQELPEKLYESLPEHQKI